MSIRPFLSAFEIIRPKNYLDQQTLLNFLAQLHSDADLEPNRLDFLKKAFNRFGCKPDRISGRGFELDDIYVEDPSQRTIYPTYPETRSVGAGMLKRTEFYCEIIKRTFEKFYHENAVAPDHIMHVTCTGYSSPSAAQHIVNLRHWGDKTGITHAYHMGCYASLSTLRLADGLVARDCDNVDLVHTELASLHLNPLDHSPEQMVVQTLFADGNVKYTVSREKPERKSFELLRIRERIVPGTSQAMTWQCADWGFKMTLSRDVPTILSQNLKPFVAELVESVETDLSKTVFAIHPGGPKIIEGAKETLNLRDDQVDHSLAIMNRFGNMSSATLPHIWNEILEDSEIPTGTCVVSLAFGPGLTLIGGVFRKC